MQENVSTPSVLKQHVRRVLARVYRPKKLEDLIGQDVLVRSLTKGIIEEHIPQAILLCGIRGTGKTSTARILARALNCLGTDGQGGMTIEPCGQCASCKACDEDRHPDIIEMDAASHTGVDDIRDLIDSAQYKAILGRFKVFIIDEVHMLSKSAFNALLKTLEEPPTHALFVFATTEIQKIPDTILSRCARFDLKRVDAQTLMRHFQTITEKEGYSIGSDALAMLARSADGSVRDGLTLLDQAMNLTHETGDKVITVHVLQSMLGQTDRQQIYKILGSVLDRNPEEAIRGARALCANGSDALMLAQDMLEALYRVACFKCIPSLAQDETIPEFERQDAQALAQKVTNTQVLSLWKMLLQGYAEMKQSPFGQQALEIVLLRLGYAAQLPPIEQLLKQSDTGPGVPTMPSAPAAQAPTPPQTSSQAPVFPESVDESTQPVTQQKITSCEELFEALNADREVLLLGCLRKDIAFVHFEEGNLTVCCKTPGSQKLLALLKMFLHKKTGMKWNILEDNSATQAQTPDEQRQALKNKQLEAVQETAFVQDLNNHFPGAKIDMV